MPWKVVKDKARCGSGFALVNSETGDLVACHKSKKGAAAQQRALYAATAKETHKADIPVMDMSAEQADEWDSLNERQQDLAESYFEAVLEYGMFDQSSKANGAHYAPAAVNPFKATGMMCMNCVFFNDVNGKQCMIVMGDIEPEAICKMWIIPEEKITEPSAKMNKWAGSAFDFSK